MRHLAHSLALSVAVFAATTQLRAESMNLTIYSKATGGAVSPDLYRPVPGQDQIGWFGASVPGYAVVRDNREIELQASRSKVHFSDVAALIDPTTVTFTSRTDTDGTKVLEQDYLFDLVSAQKLTERFLGQEITVEQVVGDKIDSTSGKLLSQGSSLVLKGADGKISAISGASNLKFPSLPDGLMTKPTLVWDISTQKPGKHAVDVSYETAGITWWSDYNLLFTPDEHNDNKGTVDLGAWVSILNQSGTSFKDAKLKLVAGDVQRAQAQSPHLGYNVNRMRAPDGAMAEASGFAEKAFFEYHLYTLGRQTTIPDRSTKQIELFPAVSHVPVEKTLVLEGSSIPYYQGYYTDRSYGLDSTPKKADVYLLFKNDKEHGLGVPLPAGRLRVSQRDEADGSLEFIGEDVIQHTPKDEKILVKLGSAFDVVAERKQDDFRTDSGRNWIQETIEIKVRNHKDKDTAVVVRESLYRAANWRITESSHAHEKRNANTIEFKLSVPKDKEQVIRYTVEYTW